MRWESWGCDVGNCSEGDCFAVVETSRGAVATARSEVNVML